MKKTQATLYQMDGARRRPTTLMSQSQSIFPPVRRKAAVISSGKRAMLPVTLMMISQSRPEPAAWAICFTDKVIAVSQEQ